MKILSASIILALLVALFTSCDDALDIKPKDKFILKTTQEYSELLDGPELSRYDITDLWNASFDGSVSESQVISGTYPLTTANYLGLEDIDRTLQATGAYNMYIYCYMRIARYNIIIDNVMSSDGIDADKKRTLGEALLLRAYNHFLLVNIYCKSYNAQTANNDGGILLRTKFDMENIPEQASVAEVYKSVEKDISDAIPNVQALGRNTNHPGLAFAYGLMAKVHLFKHEYKEALAAAEKSLSYNSYIFDWVKWDTEAKPAATISYDNRENLYYGAHISSFLPALPIGKELVQKYGVGDLRLDRFFYASHSSFTPGSRYLRAYVDTVEGKLYTRTYKLNFGGMKVSEVLLMKAECLVRDGQIAEGLALVNDLRKKRVAPASYKDLTASDKDEALKIVLDERSRELVMTPNNFFDIRRLEAEGYHQQVVRVMNRQFRGTNTFTVKSNSKTFVLPFPKEAIERNGGGLKQNVDH